MPKIFSNGPDKDFVVNPFRALLFKSKNAWLAAPYVTNPDIIIEASKLGIKIQLIVGLNSSTTPKAINSLISQENLSVRYFTSQFHAKIYIFDSGDALLGSSNLTDGGMMSNREANIHLDASFDNQAIEETRALFADLWDYAQILTPDRFSSFKQAWERIERKSPSPDRIIEDLVGLAIPANIKIESRKNTTNKLFIRNLQIEVYEQYKPSFAEIGSILQENDLRRDVFKIFPMEIEVNRFLNWVRLTYAPGEDHWQSAKIKTPAERKVKINELGAIWKITDDNKIYHNYFDNIETVRSTFSSEEAIKFASQEKIVAGLLCTHAFLEQLRFVKGGEAALPAEFWRTNKNDIEKVRSSLSYLIYGPGDFVERFHDILYQRRRKISSFGYFCALELAGTVRPEICPPINGRMAKALRFLGYEVRPR